MKVEKADGEGHRGTGNQSRLMVVDPKDRLELGEAVGALLLEYSLHVGPALNPGPR